MLEIKTDRGAHTFPFCETEREDTVRKGVTKWKRQKTRKIQGNRQKKKFSLRKVIQQDRCAECHIYTKTEVIERKKIESLSRWNTKWDKWKELRGKRKNETVKNRRCISVVWPWLALTPDGENSSIHGHKETMQCLGKCLIYKTLILYFLQP